MLGLVARTEGVGSIQHVNNDNAVGTLYTSREGKLMAHPIG